MPQPAGKITVDYDQIVAVLDPAPSDGRESGTSHAGVVLHERQAHAIARALFEVHGPKLHERLPTTVGAYVDRWDNQWLFDGDAWYVAEGPQFDEDAHLDGAGLPVPPLTAMVAAR